MQSTLRPGQLVRSLPDWTASFDHLVGGYLQRLRHSETERLSGLEVDYQVELHRLLDGQLGRLDTRKYTADVGSSLLISRSNVGSVAHETANQNELTCHIGCWNGIP